MVTRRDHLTPPRRTWATWVRAAVAGVILALLVARLGAEPFLDALGSVTGWSLALAAGVTLGTTTCCAWRWGVVARGLGLHLPLPTAVAAYYRSQLLNSTLPGGVLGDVDRAVRHGLEVGTVGRSTRAVAWERTIGQAVQVVLTVFLLLLLPSPVRGVVAAVAAVVVCVLVVGGGVAILVRDALDGRGRPLLVSRAAGAVVQDLRRVLPDARSRYAATLASALAVGGHVSVFLVAMHAAGVEAPPATRLWLALVVLLVAAVPVNLAGWGPREGAAAWAFAAAGPGAAAGVTVAVLYGVLTLVATLPGAVILVRSRGRGPYRRAARSLRVETRT